MLKRKKQQEIINWLKKDNNALLVTGARQVGKTYLIRETLKEQHLNFVEFNFIEQREYLSVFQSAMEKNAQKFLTELEVLSEGALTPNSIIFFDEIQECKEIVTIIKFLVEQGKYRYILSGSLLGVELVDLRSAPVGSLTIMTMYPLDLEEFYWANGLSENVIAELYKKFNNLEPVSETIHNYLIDAFYQYMIVGGMPKAVADFIQNKDFNRVRKIHQDIKDNYKVDFTKYEKSKKLKLIKTYDLIPSELDQKNKKYTIGNLEDNKHFDRYENSFNWLIDAGVALPVYNVTEFSIPLEASKKSTIFKLFLSDMGMLTTDYGTATILALLNHGENINCGAMFENFAAQELKAHGFKLYYFNNKKHGEVDFLIEYQNTLLPIEIKSGKDYQVHSALSYFMTKSVFNKAYVFSNANVSVKNNIIYYPIYMLMFLEANQNIKIKSQLDLSQLGE